MKVYRLPWRIIIFHSGWMVFVTIISLKYAYEIIIKGSGNSLFLLFVKLLCSVVFVIWIWICYLCLRYPWKIKLDNESFLEVQGIIGKKQIAIKDIISIKKIAKRSFIIQHIRGAITCPCQITGCKDLIERVKMANPEVKTGSF